MLLLLYESQFVLLERIKTICISTLASVSNNVFFFYSFNTIIILKMRSLPFPFFSFLFLYMLVIEGCKVVTRLSGQVRVVWVGVTWNE